ncbi:glycosyltransferase [Haemophilus haemolyticus]|uniref:glycosyltransferase n=1 Tax=Haemophilus haemolyticus TaxID=726 RepID=UPI00186563A5|nr:glycosyltransferase [Haemophilus haemolyticus]
MKKYVLFDKKNKKLENFYQNTIKDGFIEIENIPAELIDLFPDKSLVFNCLKFQETFNREVKTKDICQTLSHIQCWKAISENQLIDDNDMVLVAEADIVLVPNAIELANEYAKKYSSYNVIKLQRDFPTYNQETLFKRGDIIDALVYGNKENYNNSGASLYLIRKSIARKLFEYTIKEKPYWKADYFSDFISLVDNIRNVIQAEKLLGHTIKNKKMPENPLFSIIIPIYNTSRYLDECIISVLKQKFDNYEVILIDDGSTDDSFDICNKYRKEYGNVVFISKSNEGQSIARNIGIHLARGKYLIFLDSDDYWNNDKVLSDLEMIYYEHNPDIIINSLASVYPDQVAYHNPEYENMQGDFHKDFQYLFNKEIYLGFPVTKVIKKEIIKNNNLYFIQGRTFEDIPWSFNLVRHIKTYSIYPTIYYMYRRNTDNSTTKNVSTTNQRNLFMNFIDVYKELNYFKENIPSLYPIMLNYAYDIDKYIMKCYQLLDIESKKEVEELMEEHNIILKKIESWETC